METSEDLFEKVCRVCTVEKKSLISIFSPLDSTECDIPGKLMACARINVQLNDKLPSQICFNCLASLNAASDFQALCEKSDKFFRKMIEKEQEVQRLGKVYVKVEDNENESVATNLDKEFPKAKRQQRKSERLLQKEVLKEDTSEDGLHEKRSYTRRRPLKLHKCETCGETYKCRRDWRRHLIHNHGIKYDTLMKKIECPVCHDSFASFKFLKTHTRESGHYAKEICEHCKKVFSRSYMSVHLRSHTGEQPFLCPTCGKNFWILATFKKHTERCSNMERKFKCSYCDSAFYSSFAVRVHERIHTKEKPYVCETCGKAFRLKSKLNIHQITHTDLRPHPCPRCGQKFRQRTHLKEHMRIHTGVKPYVCDICGMGFTQGHSLKSHQIRHPLAQERTV